MTPSFWSWASSNPWLTFWLALWAIIATGEAITSLVALVATIMARKKR